MKSKNDQAFLQAILVCPATKAPLQRVGFEMWCKASGLAYPCVDGVPVLIEREARRLRLDEIDQL